MVQWNRLFRTTSSFAEKPLQTNFTHSPACLFSPCVFSGKVTSLLCPVTSMFRCACRVEIIYLSALPISCMIHRIMCWSCCHNSLVSESVPTNRCLVFGYHKAEIDSVIFVYWGNSVWRTWATAVEVAHLDTVYYKALNLIHHWLLQIFFLIIKASLTISVSLCGKNVDT